MTTFGNATVTGHAAAAQSDDEMWPDDFDWPALPPEMEREETLGLIALGLLALPLFYAWIILVALLGSVLGGRL